MCAKAKKRVQKGCFCVQKKLCVQNVCKFVLVVCNVFRLLYMIYLSIYQYVIYFVCSCVQLCAVFFSRVRTRVKAPFYQNGNNYYKNVKPLTFLRQWSTIKTMIIDLLLVLKQFRFSFFSEMHIFFFFLLLNSAIRIIFCE